VARRERRREMRGWAVAAVVVTLAGAVGCAGGGSQAGQASRGVADVGQDRSRQPLTGTEWQLTEIVEASRTWRPPPEVDAVLRFDGEGHFSATACNFYNGAVRIDGDVLHIGRMMGTQMGCGGALGAVEKAFVAVVHGAVRWRIDGEELRLDQPDGRGLRFRVRDTIYPSRDLRPLLRGQRNGGDYQFGWQAGNGGISLTWEWRDGPGKPWGFAGMNRERTWPVPRPDLLVGEASADRFVFGVVSRATARVLWRPSGGRSAVPLEVFTVPGARTWRAFGGFVDQTKGGVVVALDRHGRELGRSDLGS
jgi:heat shock protein HslJ